MQNQHYKVTRYGVNKYKIIVNDIDMPNPLTYKNKYTKQNINFDNNYLFISKDFTIEIHNNSTFTSLNPLF